MLICFGENTLTVKIESLFVASYENALELNADETKREFMFRPQNAGQNNNNKTPQTFENVARLIHLGATVTNQNCNEGETESCLNSRHAGYHSVRNLSSSCLVF